MKSCLLVGRLCSFPALAFINRCVLIWMGSADKDISAQLVWQNCENSPHLPVSPISSLSFIPLVVLAKYIGQDV